MPILYVTKMTQNENDSINLIVQHGRVVDNDCCVVFPTSRFPYLILCPRQSKWKVATTYLAIKTNNNENTFEYEKLQITNYKQQH